ncbi:MAG TPA: hypothetical protein VFX12_12965 [Vicinamibacterales bacterium]|nr:hypothetical protein [Vicinamibacterales bacterium]
MQAKQLAICASAAALAFALACNSKSPSPVSPSAATSTGIGAAAEGVTLKASAPTPVSPVNGDQPQGVLVLTAGKARGLFTDIPLSYQFQVLDTGSQIVYDSGVVGAGSGANVTLSVATSLQFDQPYTWRARAVYQGGVGPWSATASFKAPAGGYIRGAELLDPLVNGMTVGHISGPTQWVDGKGLELMSHQSYVRYQLDQTLTAGEFSLMVTGIDEGSPGVKTKVMSMEEDGGDITTNDYRFTIEKRGSGYSTPGAVTFRIITGNASDEGSIRDGRRTGVSFSDERWYFWRATWRDGYASVEVKQDGPDGRTIYFSSTGTNGHPYRPSPHVIFLGQPVGRGGPDDASIPGAIYKDVWVSGNPRPTLPVLFHKP